MNPGDRMHGYADGRFGFGRDSCTCRTVEHVGPDWMVFRSDDDRLELLQGVSLNGLEQFATRKRQWNGGPFCCGGEDDDE